MESFKEGFAKSAGSFSRHDFWRFSQ